MARGAVRLRVVLARHGRMKPPLFSVCFGSAAHRSGVGRLFCCVAPSAASWNVPERPCPTWRRAVVLRRGAAAATADNQREHTQGGGRSMNGARAFLPTWLGQTRLTHLNVAAGRSGARQIEVGARLAWCPTARALAGGARDAPRRPGRPPADRVLAAPPRPRQRGHLRASGSPVHGLAHHLDGGAGRGPAARAAPARARARVALAWREPLRSGPRKSSPPVVRSRACPWRPPCAHPSPSPESLPSPALPDRVDLRRREGPHPAPRPGGRQKSNLAVRIIR